MVNHDESTYIVISDALLAGKIYHVDYIDTKPVGIFLLYALLQLLLSKSVLMMRLAASAALALTAFLLYRSKRSFGSSPAAGYAAGFLYLLLNSVFTYYGVSPNTETFFNLFTALALWIYSSRPPVWGYFAAGLSLGLGFVIKYVVLFDGLAFGLFLFWQAYRERERWPTSLRRVSVMVVGAALPFLGVLTYYLYLGHAETFWFYTFTVSSRYPSSQAPLDYLVFFLDFNLRFLPVTVFFYYALFCKAVPRASRQFGLLWSTLILAPVLLPGTFFGHYFIQFMLPFSFVAGEFFAIARDRLPVVLRWFRNRRVIYPLMVLLLTLNLVFQYQDYYVKPDYPRQVASFLRPRLSDSDVIYTTRDQILYHLIQRLPPLPYVHPSLFWEEKHLRALEIPQEKWLRKLKKKLPRFIVFRDAYKEKTFAGILRQHYRLVWEIDKRVKIYEKISRPR